MNGEMASGSFRLYTHEKNTMKLVAMTIGYITSFGNDLRVFRTE